jgi:curved DNA-binding protein CbpA
LISGINVFALPLSTKEGFVLSRVDGSASVEDISIMVGIKQDELLSILERLSELGAVRLSWVAPRRQSPAARIQHPPPSGPQPLRAESAVARALAEPDDILYNPRELEEEADIPLDVKRRILNAFYSLEDRTYYDMLGVAPDADKKVIRAAYFELSKLFHPDALFGKRLGSYKTKMEVVFQRMTEAYEALGRKNKRKEYDDYLATTRKTTQLRETLEQVERNSVSLVGPSPFAEHDSEPPPREPRRAVMPPAGPDARTPSQASLRPPATPDERRVLMRDKLRRSFRGDSSPAPAALGGKGSTPGAKPPSTQPPAAPGSDGPKERRDSVITGLRRSLRAARAVTDRSGTDPVIAHIKRAKEAEIAGDLMSAASALQSALALDPERREIQEQYERVSRAVSRQLADNYEKQARYEEKMGKWEAAALSWGRVADGRPEDPNAARAAAEAMLKARGDLHRAQKLAQRAVDLVPNSASHLVLLARVFLAVGLRLNAKRELEKAVKLDPQDEMIKNLLNEAR